MGAVALGYISVAFLGMALVFLPIRKKKKTLTKRYQTKAALQIKEAFHDPARVLLARGKSRGGRIMAETIGSEISRGIIWRTGQMHH